MLSQEISSLCRALGCAIREQLIKTSLASAFNATQQAAAASKAPDKTPDASPLGKEETPIVTINKI